jgi:hypothetical protein
VVLRVLGGLKIAVAKSIRLFNPLVNLAVPALSPPIAHSLWDTQGI